MNILKTGALVFGLTLGIMPLAAHADDSSGGDAEVNATVTARPTLYTAQPTAIKINHDSEESGESADTEHGEMRSSTTIRVSEQEREQRMASSSDEERGNATSTAAREHAFEQFQERIQLKLESTTTPAQTIEQFKQMLEQRKQELDQEASSTATSTRAILKDANQIRLAVHALLASKDLLGGIGQQVSDIAQQVNQSVATTTNAEAQIQSRGFWTKLLFGGDTNAANAIADQVAQNKERIAHITDLLNQSTTTADIKVELQAQIDALNAEQVRLQAVAASQQKLWGLFSWRF